MMLLGVVPTCVQLTHVAYSPSTIAAVYFAAQPHGTKAIRPLRTSLAVVAFRTISMLWLTDVWYSVT